MTEEENIALNKTRLSLDHGGELALQTNLFQVLLCFRRFLVAVACDVSEILQIRIPPQDRPNFRFLWRHLEVDRNLDVYEFESLVFGDASAPFRAQFVSQENARIHEIAACSRNHKKVNTCG